LLFESDVNTESCHSNSWTFAMYQLWYQSVLVLACGCRHWKFGQNLFRWKINQSMWVAKIT